MSIFLAPPVSNIHICRISLPSERPDLARTYKPLPGSSCGWLRGIQHLLPVRDCSGPVAGDQNTPIPHRQHAATSPVISRPRRRAMDERTSANPQARASVSQGKSGQFPPNLGGFAIFRLFPGVSASNLSWQGATERALLLCRGDRWRRSHLALRRVFPLSFSGHQPHLL